MNRGWVLRQIQSIWLKTQETRMRVDLTYLSKVIYGTIVYRLTPIHCQDSPDYIIFAFTLWVYTKTIKNNDFFHRKCKLLKMVSEVERFENAMISLSCGQIVFTENANLRTMQQQSQIQSNYLDTQTIDFRWLLPF